MSKTVIKFPRKRRTANKRSRRTVFYLGDHTYSAGPGCSWSTRYWIKKLRDGKHFEIYCTTEETGARRVYFDTVTAEGAMEHFDGVGFEVGDATAYAIGLRVPILEDEEVEIVQLDEYRRAREEEDVTST